jgi:TatD DNase family protein
MTSKSIPIYNSPIIETHCHLDYLTGPVEHIIAEAAAVGIERIITISVSPDNLDHVIALTNEHANVWGTQGIHPHEAEKYDHNVEQTIRDNLSSNKIVAVGEIGLDYFYNNAPNIKQISCFEQQLNIAASMNKPVVIHSRDADDDMRSILKNHESTLLKKGVIHSFTSSVELAEYCLSAGFYLGFNGISTFKKAENVRDIIRITPLERILLETDAPYLTPTPYRGKENAPKYLPFIAKNIAEIKNIDIDECLKQCHRNSLELFFNNEN